MAGVGIRPLALARRQLARMSCPGVSYQFLSMVVRALPGWRARAGRRAGDRWCSPCPCGCRGSRRVVPPAAVPPGPRIKLHECRVHVA
jgi:hypothetical protein